MNQPSTADADTITQEKAQALLEENEAESRLRTYPGFMGRIIAVLLVLWTGFQLYYTTLGAISAVNLRAFHCIFLLLFTFLLFPAYRREKRIRTLPSLWDMALIAVSTGSLLYLVMNYTRIAQQGGRVTSFELGIATAALFCI